AASSSLVTRAIPSLIGNDAQNKRRDFSLALFCFCAAFLATKPAKHVRAFFFENRSKNTCLNWVVFI
ncbi:hypothetical protein, partial [uncultured Thalassospira sp.]|uniref:hypothetical protein n=1 Tax=uncultured Thalassospira sp. TaxID=404382 RepID=UPI0030D740F3